MMKYTALAGCAIIGASLLLALQIIGGLEYTEGQSDYVRWSMIAAMVTVALMPMFIHAAWRVSKTMALGLFVGFVAFLAYSLPASIGRVGEMKEAKALVGSDVETIRSELADLRATLKWAEPDAMAECEGAPSVIPAGRWPECRRKRGNVKAFQEQKRRLEDQLSKIGTSDQLGDTSSKILAWAFSPLAIKEETIRKASGIALPIGLEIVIFSLYGLASAALWKGWEGRATVAKASLAERQPLAALSVANDAVPALDSQRVAHSREAALADLTFLIKAGQHPESQGWLAERWGTSKSCVSKWLRHWEMTEQLPGNRRPEGRRKMVVSA